MVHVLLNNIVQFPNDFLFCSVHHSSDDFILTAAILSSVKSKSSVICFKLFQPVSSKVKTCDLHMLVSMCFDLQRAIPHR